MKKLLLISVCLAALSTQVYAVEMPKELRGTWCPASMTSGVTRYERDYERTKPPCARAVGIDVDPTQALVVFSDGYRRGAGTKPDAMCKLIDAIAAVKNADGDRGRELAFDCKSRNDEWTETAKFWALKSSHWNELLDVETHRNARLPERMTGLWCVSLSKKAPGTAMTNVSTWIRKDRHGKTCRQEGNTEWIYVHPNGSYSGSEYECKAVKVAGGGVAYSITLHCDGEESTWSEAQKLELVAGELRSVRTTTNLKLSR